MAWLGDCRHGVAHRLVARRLSASHGMEVVAGGCWHGMEVVAMAWLMLLPWRGSQVVGIAWLTGCRHGVAHRLSASHGSEVVAVAWLMEEDIPAAVGMKRLRKDCWGRHPLCRRPRRRSRNPNTASCWKRFCRLC